MEKSKDNRFVIIVKIEKYIEYMLTILLKLPRTEKFSIGTEVKTSMYEMMKNILLASKIDKNKRLQIYNNELDQYVKHKLKCEYYYRYMDDMVIMCKNKEIAKDSLNNITKFLKENLKLTLNSKTRIFKDIQGVNFCGYKINEKRLKIRHTSKCRMKRKLKRYTRQLKEGKITLTEIQRSIAGWLGYVKHADSYKLRKSMFYIEG